MECGVQLKKLRKERNKQKESCSFITTITESKLNTTKEQNYRKTGMTQAEIKKALSKKGRLKLFLGKVTGAKGYQLQYAMNKKF